MKMMHDGSAEADTLTHLRAESLKWLAFGVGLPGYVWLIVVIWPESHLPSEAWLGCGLLILGVILGYALRWRRPHFASGLLVAGALAAITGAILAFNLLTLSYLFIVPVILTSALFGPLPTVLVAGGAGLFTIALSLYRLGLSPLGLDMWLPVGVLALVTTAECLAAHNLYSVFSWVWNAYELAHKNEQIAREGRAELQRILKALDDATYRLERANYSLALARDQAEEARRLKQQFAQTISHELRTPLNLIVGFSELMIQTPEYYGVQFTPSFARDLTIVYRNACHLQKLVNDVLDLARIEAAQVGLQPEMVNPANLVQEAVNTACSLVEARGLVLHTSIAPDLPRLWVDPTRIRQVLFNLLNNAARFTEQGSITVSVDRQGEEVVFAVADTGVGIAPEDVPRIFEEFRQLDGGTQRRHGGVGLGLPISRRFVELHGGRIWVESQVGKGSTFFFSLPITQRNLLISPVNQLSVLPSRAAAQGRASRWRSSRNMTAIHESPLLLAVTRSPTAATLLTRYVRGCHTTVVQDLEQAKRAARQLLPQTVVIDTVHVKLAPEELQELPKIWGLPECLILACRLPGEESLREELAVDGYLVKPVSRQNLWDALRRFGDHVDRVLVVDDDLDFVRLMERFLTSPPRPYVVGTAHKGREALEIIRRQPPDLVLLDLMLPDMAGSQFITQLRATWRSLPIIAVSACDTPSLQYARPGPMFVAKGRGFTPGEIVWWIQHAIEVGKSQPPPFTQS